MSVSFKYDPFGRRIYKSSSTTTSVYAYDGDNQVEATNSSGAAVARYSQSLDIDEPLAMLRGGATSYYNADGLGSITSLGNAAGTLAQTYTFVSFGKQTASSGSLTNPFEYTARESDPETGLRYYRARYYNFNVGRFLSEDPIRFTGSGTNFFSMLSNNPVNATDSLGLAADPWGSLFGRKLSDCAKDLLQPYFPGFDLSKIRLHLDNSLGNFRTSAVTHGNQIYFDPDDVNGSVSGISVLGHEIRHSVQVQQDGLLGFYWNYSGEWYFNGWMGLHGYDNYRHIHYEEEGFEIENRIFSDLADKFGAFGQPCKQICK